MEVLSAILGLSQREDRFLRSNSFELLSRFMAARLLYVIQNVRL